MAGLADFFATAKAQYPVLNDPALAFKFSPGKPGAFGYMESYPPNETGSTQNPRPAEFPMSTFGVEVYRPDTTPDDIMADVASHKMIYDEPVLAKMFTNFRQSMTGDQMNRLYGQYMHARSGAEGYVEDRPFQDWAGSSGLPAWFRGRAFDQWPRDFTDNVFSPGQRALLDQVRPYLQKPR